MAKLFVKCLATILIAALAGAFAVVGGLLIGRGLGALLGAFLIGRHAFVAIAIMVLLGVISLIIASGMCWVLPLIWSYRRNRESGSVSKLRPHVEVRLHFLGQQDSSDGGPLYSGFRAVFRYHEVVDDVTLVLVGASQLARGEEGTARLTFADLARHLAYLQEGLEFDVLDREQRCICRGVISNILVRVNPKD